MNKNYFKANESGSSNAMELDGAKRCFQFVKDAGLKISSFVSDRHKGIAKWIRESQPETSHFNDTKKRSTRMAAIIIIEKRQFQS